MNGCNRRNLGRTLYPFVRKDETFTKSRSGSDKGIFEDMLPQRIQAAASSPLSPTHLLVTRTSPGNSNALNGGHCSASGDKQIAGPLIKLYPSPLPGPPDKRNKGRERGVQEERGEDVSRGRLNDERLAAPAVTAMPAASSTNSCWAAMSLSATRPCLSVLSSSRDWLRGIESMSADPTGSGTSSTSDALLEMKVHCE